MLSKSRAAALPNVPTMAEAGYPQVEGDVWIGVLAPAKTPAEITDLLHREITAVLARPDVAKLFGDQGLAAVAIGRPAFGQRLQDEIELWRKIVEATDMKIR